MDHPIIQIIMRVIHITSVTLIVGGMSFQSFCAWPSLRLVDDKLRESLKELMRKYFERIVLIGIAGLILSGVYNWWLLNDVYTAMKQTVGGGKIPIAQILIGTKVLLALIIFCVAFARIYGLIKPTRFTHTFNLHLAVVVMILAAVLHYYRLQHLAMLAGSAVKSALP